MLVLKRMTSRWIYEGDKGLTPTDVAATNKIITAAYITADATLKADLTSDYKAADATLKTDLKSDYKAADATLKSDLTAD